MYRRVALLAEGVDRNRVMLDMSGSDASSPSSRRAWIEIAMAEGLAEAIDVALLAEGVDRNWSKLDKPMNRRRRPPRGGRG